MILAVLPASWTMHLCLWLDDFTESNSCSELLLITLKCSFLQRLTNCCWIESVGDVGAFSDCQIVIFLSNAKIYLSEVYNSKKLNCWFTEKNLSAELSVVYTFFCRNFVGTISYYASTAHWYHTFTLLMSVCITSEILTSIKCIAYGCHTYCM